MGYLSESQLISCQDCSGSFQFCDRSANNICFSNHFRETIREIFEPNERKPFFEHRRIRYKSNDCCFEVEEDQPWNIDDLFEEASAVAIQ